MMKTLQVLKRRARPSEWHQNCLSTQGDYSTALAIIVWMSWNTNAGGTNLPSPSGRGAGGEGRHFLGQLRGKAQLPAETYRKD
jgi:hypothetical protein